MLYLFSRGHLQAIRAYPFDHHITKDHHLELRNFVDRIKMNVSKDIQMLKSKGAQTFNGFAKQVR